MHSFGVLARRQRRREQARGAMGDAVHTWTGQWVESGAGSRRGFGEIRPNSIFRWASALKFQKAARSRAAHHGGFRIGVELQSVCAANRLLSTADRHHRNYALAREKAWALRSMRGLARAKACGRSQERWPTRLRDLRICGNPAGDVSHASDLRLGLPLRPPGSSVAPARALDPYSAKSARPARSLGLGPK